MQLDITGQLAVGLAQTLSNLFIPGNETSLFVSGDLGFLTLCEQCVIVYKGSLINITIKGQAANYNRLHNFF